MSVLIRNMEMPINCHSCPMCFMRFCQAADRELSEREIKPNAKRPDDCPLVEIPPHGRLIDADALVKKQPIPELGAPRWLIEQAPTIIESEGADER